MAAKKIRVLVVDDSAVVRQALSNLLSSDPGIEVMGTASDPFVAADRIAEEIPDVITLDIEMPRMDGLTFLKMIMTQHPVPVVICSSLAEEGAQSTLRALEYGAVDIITKPRLGTRQYLEDSRTVHLRYRESGCAGAGWASRALNIIVQPKLTADVILPQATRAMDETTEKVIVVGASTGGTEALKSLLETLPPDAPGIVIVQHMPELFTRAFANRLDGLCAITVKEAETNDTVLRGRALIAPGNHHMLLRRSGARYFVEIKDGPLVCRHRPSVDVLFRSAARYAGPNAVGVILTGMGDDGARGMLEMKQAGAFNIAQDEASSVVFGMPKEAIKLDGVHKVLPLDHIPGRDPQTRRMNLTATTTQFSRDNALRKCSRTRKRAAALRGDAAAASLAYNTALNSCLLAALFALCRMHHAVACAAVRPHQQQDVLARRNSVHIIRKFLRILDRLAVHFLDHVARCKSRILRRARRPNTRHRCSLHV